MLPLLALLLPPTALAASLPEPDPLGDDPAPLVVTVALDTLRPPVPPPPPPPVGLLPTSLSLTVTPGDETALDLVLDLDVLTAGPVHLPVIGADLALSSATLDGRPVALPPDASGWRALAAVLPAGRHRLRLVGSVATPRPALSLPLLPSPRATVQVQGPWQSSLAQGLPTGPGRFSLPPTGAVALSWRPPTPPAPRPGVVQARMAAALRVDASGIQGRAHVRATAAHQPVSHLDLRLPPVEDLQVEGAAVAGWERSGDGVRVRLSRPLLGTVELSLSWRAPAPAADGGPASLPLPVTTSGQLEQGFVTVHMGDQGTVVPRADRGLQPVAGRDLPAWGRGLVDGAVVTTLAMTGNSPALSLRVLDLSPVDAPPTFVDEARIEVAYAAHGRALLRCRYQVRNDRNQYLALTLPDGARPLGVRVAGRVVQPVRDGDRLFIPLEKSVETLSGLVAFPVEVALLAPEAPWEARGRRTLSAPAVDAPVAQARWEVVLPPGARQREVDGRPTVVQAWTEGGEVLVIDRVAAVGDGTLALEDAAEARREQSQETWNLAYRAYQDNRFDVARGMLEQSLAWDGDNQAARDLLQNVDVLTGEDRDQDDDQARRVRAMARAKTSGLESEQSEKKQEAEDALRAGNYEAAQVVLEELELLTRDLAVVEDTESVDQKVMLEETRQRLDEVTVALKRKKDAQDKERRSEVPVVEVVEAEAVDEWPPEPSPVDEWEEAADLPIAQGELVIVVDGVLPPERAAAEQGVAGLLAGLNGSDAAPKPQAQPSPDTAVAFRGGGRGTGLGSRGAGLGGGGTAEATGADARRAPASKKPAEAPPPPPAPPPATVTASSSSSTVPPTRSSAPSPSAPAGSTVPTALAMDPAVTAAPLSVRPPRAGQRLLLEQKLLAPGDALTVTLTYRLRD